MLVYFFHQFKGKQITLKKEFPFFKIKILLDFDRNKSNTQKTLYSSTPCFQHYLVLLAPRQKQWYHSWLWLSVTLPTLSSNVGHGGWREDLGWGGMFKRRKTLKTVRMNSSGTNRRRKWQNSAVMPNCLRNRLEIRYVNGRPKIPSVMREEDLVSCCLSSRGQNPHQSAFSQINFQLISCTTERWRSWS